MADPVNEIQGAIITRLKANAPLAALVGSRIGDIPPLTWQKPYVSIGPTNFVPEYADCIDAGEVMIQIDVSSDATILEEVRTVADAVRKALRGWEPTLTDNALVSFEHWRTDYIRADALHFASIRYTALIEEP